ncbi:MAG: hypothetical protein ACLQU2_06035 [Candidatus Binataceae bacterium]
MAAASPSAASNPAVITDNSKDPLFYDDFMRITFLPKSVDVMTPGKSGPNGILRAFFGSTRFYAPPIPVTRIADFNGFKPVASYDLVAMRCQPRLGDADPRLAIWPNLAHMLIADLADRHFSCASPSTPENVAFCLAENYKDTPEPLAVTALINALKFAEELFALKGGNLLYDLYGIDPDHSGLGLVVKGPVVPNITAAETLTQSVVPEYLLKNINLADLNCRCIRVAGYPGRDQSVLPADLVWNQGKLGSGGLCSQYVKKLPNS